MKNISPNSNSTWNQNSPIKLKQTRLLLVISLGDGSVWQIKTKPTIVQTTER